MKYAIIIIIGLLIGAISGLFQLRVRELRLEGEAKSAMIRQFQGMEIPPEQARFAQIVVTTTDVQISMAQAKINIFEGNN